MNDVQRKYLLLGIAGVLLVANLFRWYGGDGFETSGFFSGLGEMDLNPRQQKLLEDLERLPRLDFSVGRPVEKVDVTRQRNPFIFGEDRRRKKVRAERMAALAEQRTQMRAAQEARREALARAVAEETAKPRFTGRLVGIMRDSGSGSAMVSFALGEEIHIVRPGELVGNEFRLVAVADAKVVLSTLATGEELVIEVEIN